MANRLISPSLADLDQDIAGAIPLDIILRWSMGKKDKETHSSILSPFTVKGTVVSSDSAGLSKLTQDRSLLEVMKLVSEPKEVIFNYGRAIGGTHVGIWAADNTEMFYADSIDPTDVLHHMIAAQKDIRGLTVHIGLGFHFGEFIQIGGGLFGKEADIVEDLAENYTEGGEIAFTGAFQKKIKKDFQQALVKKEIAELKGIFYSLEYENFAHKASRSGQYHYPYPFTKDFFQFIRSYPKTKGANTFDKYAKEKVVILVKVIHARKKFLLDELAHWLLANTILKKITVLTEIEEIKSNGSLGIFVTDNVSQAIEFASDLKDTMAANGYVANVGISKGEVLIFPLDQGGKEIAGGPVNIASKLAEDSDEKGKVMIEDTVNVTGKISVPVEKFQIKLSAVELNGVKF